MYGEFVLLAFGSSSYWQEIEVALCSRSCAVNFFFLTLSLLQLGVLKGLKTSTCEISPSKFAVSPTKSKQQTQEQEKKKLHRCLKLQQSNNNNFFIYKYRFHFHFFFLNSKRKYQSESLKVWIPWTKENYRRIIR